MMRIILFILAISIWFIGCDRESRNFRVQPPYASRAETGRMTTLQPGIAQPEPTIRNAYEENAYAMSEGKRLYSAFNCNGCHANGGGDIGPPLMDSTWIYGSRPEQIFSTIVEGRPNGMPSFRGRISDYQVWQIVAYVRSMSGMTSQMAAPGRNDDMHTGEPENSRPGQRPTGSSRPRSVEMPQ